MDDITHTFDLDEAPGKDETRPRARPAANSPTLHQLRIFHAVARAATLTGAAKDVGLTQPSLSQQLGRLETAIGTRLFHRRPGEMELTEAGRYLLPQVEMMLRILSETEDGLARFRGGYQPVVKLAGIDSVLRSLLSHAVGDLQRRFPDLRFEVQEGAPGDILDLLYARRINIGLLAANSLAPAHTHFQQVPVFEDPWVLAVPEGLALDDVSDPGRQLTSEAQAVLRRTVDFVFGSAQSSRVATWYDQFLPGHHPVAQCRSFDTALGFVRAGVGVCVAPALATLGLQGPLTGIRRYRIPLATRQVVALVLSQNRRIEPVASLLDALAEAGARISLPEILPTPPFLTGPGEGASSSMGDVGRAGGDLL